MGGIVLRTWFSIRVCFGMDLGHYRSFIGQMLKRVEQLKRLIKPAQLTKNYISNSFAAGVFLPRKCVLGFVGDVLVEQTHVVWFCCVFPEKCESLSRAQLISELIFTGTMPPNISPQALLSPRNTPRDVLGISSLKNDRVSSLCLNDWDLL